MKLIILLFPLFSVASAVDVPYSLNIQEAIIYPDGVKKSPALTFNGQFPGPLISANLGDEFKISVINSLPADATSVHWHGMYQNGSQWQDGPYMITQCPLQRDETQLYQFAAAQSGTYWYHAHYHSQYTDGMVGPLVIKDPTDPARYGYDAEIILVLGDWYHTNHQENENFYMNTGVPPFPNSALINGKGLYPCLVVLDALKLDYILQPNCDASKQLRSLYRIQPGKTYRIRVINTSAMSAFDFSIDGHKLKIIETDGVSLAQPSAPLDFVEIGTAQRYSFIVSMDQTPKSYTIRALMKTDFLSLLERVNPNLNINVEKTLRPMATAVLTYDNTKISADTTEENQPFPWTLYSKESQAPQRQNPVFLNEMALVPKDEPNAPTTFDQEFTLNVSITTVGVKPRTLFNGKPFQLPHEEPLLATWWRGEPLSDMANPIVVSQGQVVQVVLNNNEPIQHPIHLHGHTFWVVGKGALGDGSYNVSKPLQTTTVKRDTALLNGMSWMVIRFIADNPGVWTMHCHIDWHNAGGMAVTWVEGLNAGKPVPVEAQRICSLAGMTSVR